MAVCFSLSEKKCKTVIRRGTVNAELDLPLSQPNEAQTRFVGESGDTNELFFKRR